MKTAYCAAFAKVTGSVYDPELSRQAIQYEQPGAITRIDSTVNLDAPAD